MGLPNSVDVAADLKVGVEDLDGFIKLRFSGKINEDFDFNKALQGLNPVFTGSSKAVVFDMGEVSQINSVGVRAWLLFIERVQAAKTAFFFRINELMIEQASIVPNMLGKKGTHVLMCDVPYFCSACSLRVVKSMKTKDVVKDDGTFNLPPEKCEKCGGEMEFDAVEEEYFNFLKYATVYKG